MINRHEYRDFITDLVKKNGIERHIFKKLGFDFKENSNLVAPRFDLFVEKYNNLLDELAIPESKRIRPAIVLENYKNDIVLVRPSIDPWPSGTRWHLANEVRLRSRLMSSNVAEGRYPIFFEGIHDVIHMVLFAIYPDYAESIRSGSLKLSKNMHQGFMSRVTFNIEALSLGNPEKIEEIKSQISISHLTKQSSFYDFVAALVCERKLKKLSLLNIGII
ncbi:MAG: hypothetical protein JNL11_00245 [Bdellovibrionaceae bacterium]|nr:hypothetical protein [Pseudobdellovibrionaceae bacterium]